MKFYSHSEISTYLDCQKKWELTYLKGLRLDNIHFQFGTMAHKVMETRVIPDETLYPNLKDAFNIKSWNNYFTTILNELDDRMKNYECLYRELEFELDNIRGVIDAVWFNKNTKRYLITDYKFSNTIKTHTDVLLDEQMYIYAVAFGIKNKIPISNIDIGYINIPKVETSEPRVLRNGTLSKDKSQNTTYDKYLKAIQENKLNVDDYSDILEDLKNKKFLQISITRINEDMLMRIMENIDKTIQDMNKGYVLEKCSFMCKRCEYLPYCKYNKEIPKCE